MVEPLGVASKDGPSFMLLKEHGCGAMLFRASWLLTVATSTAAWADAPMEMKAVLRRIPSSWTELHQKKGGEFEIPKYCDAGPATVRILGIGDTHPRLEVFQGQDTEVFEIVAAEVVAKASQPAIRLRLQSQGKQAPVRVVQFDYQDAPHGRGAWSETDAGDASVLFKGHKVFASQEKLNLYPTQWVDCLEGGEGP